MTAYATAADLVARHDTNLIGELIRDDHETALPSEIEDSTVVETVLTDASGQVEAAMLCGNRYSPEQLSELTGNSLGLLKKIVCLIALAELLNRRPGRHIEIAKHYDDQSRAYLEDLRTGKNLFNLTDSEANRIAANPSTTGPTVVEYERLNLLPEQMLRHFPSRQSRLPSGR
jgi:phage gp36-like protein